MQWKKFQKHFSSQTSLPRIRDVHGVVSLGRKITYSYCFGSIESEYYSLDGYGKSCYIVGEVILRRLKNMLVQNVHVKEAFSLYGIIPLPNKTFFLLTRLGVLLFASLEGPHEWSDLQCY